VTVRGEGEVRITFERTALFEIVDGGSLKLVGVKISGAEAPDVAGNAAIRTSRYSMLNNYALVVEGSVVEDLDTNHSFNFFALAKHTFADRIEIRNSTFRNVTGSILALNREDDDLGIYNGEYIRIDNSEFRKIGGAIADIYRGGTGDRHPRQRVRGQLADSGNGDGRRTGHKAERQHVRRNGGAGNPANWSRAMSAAVCRIAPLGSIKAHGESD
jgi:hypothetical protein